MNSAFVYFYDDFLGSPRYERDLSLIENELAVKGIAGTIVRLTVMRDDVGSIKDRISNGAKNLIFVGNDLTVEKMMRLVPDNPDVTLGFIPIDETSKIAKLLGMPSGQPGVDVIAARLVEIIDLGTVGNRHFLTECLVLNGQAELEIEGKYRLAPKNGGAIAVRNLGSLSQNNRIAADPKDGFLEAIIQAPVGKRPGWWKKSELSETKIPFKFGRMIAKQQIPFYIDGKEYLGTEFSLGIEPKRLKIITGRSRRLT